MKMHCYILDRLQVKILQQQKQTVRSIEIPPFIQAEFPFVLKKDIYTGPTAQ